MLTGDVATTIQDLTTTTIQDKEHLLIEQQLSSKHRGQKFCRVSI